MSTLVLCLDGLDYEYVTENGLLPSLNPQLLRQDFDGRNALYTFRVWPCIMAGIVGGESTYKYDEWEPDEPYVWEKFPGTAINVPVHIFGATTDEELWPSEYMEEYKPPGRLDDTLEKVRDATLEALDRDDPLVVAGHRTPDIASHKLPEMAPEYIRKSCEMAEELVEEADEHLLVSDHGFGEFGTIGVDGHRRTATLASSFCEYDTMTSFVEGWYDDLAGVLRRQHLDSMGYT